MGTEGYNIKLTECESQIFHIFFLQFVHIFSRSFIMKKTVTVCLSILCGSAMLFAADFSKNSINELQNMAGKVAPKDVLDYRIEINKRIDAMTVKEAREFKEALHNAVHNNQSKMTAEELRKYRAEVKAETQKRLDAMTVKEAREKGALRGMGHGRNCNHHDGAHTHHHTQHHDGAHTHTHHYGV